MKKYIFSAIFFSLLTVLALWGYCEFFIQNQDKSVAAEPVKAVTTSLTQTSGSEEQTGSATATSTTQKEDLNSGELVGPILPQNEEEASLCSKCQTSNWLPFTGFPSFSSLTNSAKSFLDNALDCTSCGEMIGSTVDPTEERETDNVEEVKQ